MIAIGIKFVCVVLMINLLHFILCSYNFIYFIPIVSKNNTQSEVLQNSSWAGKFALFSCLSK